jgi:hypothetical protein
LYYLIRIVADLRQNLRVHEQDVGHGEEGHDAGAEFSPYGGPAFFNAKIIQHMLLDTLSSPSVVVHVVIAARDADAVFLGIGVVVVVVLLLLLLVVLPMPVACDGGIAVHGTVWETRGREGGREGWKDGEKGSAGVNVAIVVLLLLLLLLLAAAVLCVAGRKAVGTS